MVFPMLVQRPFTGKTGVDQLFCKKNLVGVEQGALKRLQESFKNFQKNLVRIESREEFFKKNPRLLIGPLDERTLNRMLPFSLLSQKVSGLPIPCYPIHIVIYYNHLERKDKLSVLIKSDEEIIETIKEVLGAYSMDPAPIDSRKDAAYMLPDGLLKTHVLPYLRALSKRDLNALERKILKVSSEYFYSCFVKMQSTVKKKLNNDFHS